ncbi:unnamed protein product [Brachionus calyciflorus]|uniref:Uncharacterized protein n=1 Tax=Brachionus calyciflorus TaxID=104777 RepID=A0A814FTQ4_9BILA|nr:unnamed protein product [Brachionus calyciflorus]
MQAIKRTIIDYSTDVVNEIDIQCEKVFEKLNDKNQLEKMSTINNIRKMMIESVHEIERLNLNDLSIETKCAFEKKFFFFIPNNEMKIVPLNNKDIETQMILNNEIGILVILNQFEQNTFISSFRCGIKTLDESAVKNSFETFEDITKFVIIIMLMKKRLALAPNTFIYDLTNKVDNIIESININASGIRSVSEIDLNFFEKLINLEYLDSLKIEVSKLDRIKKGNFSILKNLNELTLKFQDIKKFEDNSFLGLNNLNYLTLFGIKETQVNFFNCLRNLKRLTFAAGDFSKLSSSFFKDLYNLKNLTFFQCKFSSIKKDTFLDLNNLECLNILSSQIEYLDEDCLNGLENLTKLHINAHNNLYFINSLKIHVNTFKTCQNLEILNFDNCKLNDSDMTLIHDFKKLKYLVLADNFIRQMEFLNNFHNLEALDIFDIKFNQDQFDRLTLSNLKYFKFSSDTIPHFNENFKSLQAINGRIAVFCRDIASRLKHLENLDCLQLRITSFQIDPNETFKFIENLKIFDFIFTAFFFSNESKRGLKILYQVLEKYFDQEKTQDYHFKELSHYRAIFQVFLKYF